MGGGVGVGAVTGAGAGAPGGHALLPLSSHHPSCPRD